MIKIGMIIDVVGFFCGLYLAYRAGKYIGREEGFNDGFSEGQNEAYREVENILNKKLAHAEDTTTEGA